MANYVYMYDRVATTEGYMRDNWLYPIIFNGNRDYPPNYKPAGWTA